VAGVFGGLKPHESEMPRNGENRLLTAKMAVISRVDDKRVRRQKGRTIDCALPGLHEPVACTGVDGTYAARSMNHSFPQSPRPQTRDADCSAHSPAMLGWCPYRSRMNAPPRATSMPDDRLDHRRLIREGGTPNEHDPPNASAADRAAVHSILPFPAPPHLSVYITKLQRQSNNAVA
jgi:hypothetical protein